MRAARCPKCEGEMADGFLVDRGDNHSARLPGWIAGAPERGWLGGLKVRGKTRLEVVTRRCRKCGFLESFAPEVAG